MMIDRQILTAIKNVGVLPVFCPKSQGEYEVFRDAVKETPLPAVEITLRSAFAVDAIKQLKSDLPYLVVGAGTVLSPEKLDLAAETGADFCVSPGYSEKLIEYAEEKGIPFLPGVATPSEIQNALMRGMTVLKYFPAEVSGGAKALTLYNGAFNDAAFIPTGGITLDNLKSYQALPNVIACGGSFMLPKDSLMAGDSASIRDTILSCIRE